MNKRARFTEEKEFLTEDLRVEDSYDIGYPDNEANEVNQEQTNKKDLSEEIEISILNALIEISTERGLSTSKTKKELFARMKELHDGKGEEFTQSQINDKVKKLKKKFNKNLAKGKSHSTQHEIEIFELSNKVWGGAKASESIKNLDLLLLGGTESGKYETTLDEKFGELGETVIEQALGQLGEANRSQLKKEWHELQILELELTAKKAQLIQFQTEIMLDAFKNTTIKQ